MRVGLDITKAVSPRDGVGYYTDELLGTLAAEIAATPDPELELWLYCLSDADLKDLRARATGWSPRLQIRTAPPAEDALDLFHVTGWAVPQPLSAPLLYTCYDLTFLSHPALHTLDNRLHCLTGVLQAHLADATFVAISQATALEMEKLLGLPSSQLHVIHPAVSEVFRRRSAEEAGQLLQRRFGIAGRRSEGQGGFVLAVGTLEPRKNLARLVEAYAGLATDLKQRFPLLIAGGDGWKLNRKELIQDPHVHTLGFVDRSDLVALYNAATVFAYPSLAEGFGLPVLEAMSCGAAVITSNTSSLPEVAGQAARLIDPLDTAALRQALQDLIERPAERERLAAMGLERASQFSWRRTARQTLDLYRQIVNAP